MILYKEIFCLFNVLGKLNVSVNVENVTSSSVWLSYSISPELREVSGLVFSIQYNSTTSNTQSSMNFTILSGIVTLTGLSPNTQYVFWMRAMTSDGMTVSSEQMSFMTALVGELVCLVEFLILTVHIE